MDEEKFNATSISDIKEELRKYGYEIETVKMLSMLFNYISILKMQQGIWI